MSREREKLGCDTDSTKPQLTWGGKRAGISWGSGPRVDMDGDCLGQQRSPPLNVTRYVLSCPWASSPPVKGVWAVHLHVYYTRKLLQKAPRKGGDGCHGNTVPRGRVVGISCLEEVT